MSIEAISNPDFLHDHRALNALKNKPRKTNSLVSSIFSSDKNHDGKITQTEIESSYKNINKKLEWLHSIKNRVNRNFYRSYEKQLKNKKEDLALVRENFNVFGHRTKHDEHGLLTGESVIDKSRIAELKNAAKSDGNRRDFSYTDFINLEGPRMLPVEVLEN